MSLNYYTYKKEKLKCPKCGWKGTGEETVTGEPFEAVFEIDCPKCHEPIGSIGYPTVDDILIYGTEEEKKEAREIKANLEKKVIPFAEEGQIDSEKVKNAVYNRIDFELPEWLWVKERFNI